ncbi:FkbM family methyltransferase [Piscinibacter sp.]|uniref:FkbM family methyltransferase n=1 Tax=Piscinibacter sp. TaxID=1903157 RepID=UPI002C71BB03|nr:FkbM family methyltransferase [Albitalea sp.]HUG22137.1 FkbM family methyltransferase [Albitalea sp.]
MIPTHKLKRRLRLWVKELLRPFNFAVPATPYGARFMVPIIRGVGGSHRQGVEPWMVDTLRRLFHSSGRAGLIDIGVNIGQTLLKLKSVDQNARYIGFEPNPFCVQYANEIIRLNRLSQCVVIPVALADKPGLVDFVADSEADAAASTLPDLRPGKQSVRRQYVPTLAFDEIGSLETDSIPVVKIDVEGAELEVLRGMKRFLADSRPCVICEVLHAHTDQQIPLLRARNDDLMSLLVNAGYVVHRIIKNSPQTQVVELVPVPRFPDEVYTFRSSAVCDYLIIPAEKTAQVVAAFGKAAGVDPAAEGDDNWARPKAA